MHHFSQFFHGKSRNPLPFTHMMALQAIGVQDLRLPQVLKSSATAKLNGELAADAVFLFSLLKAEGNNTQADVILGLDTNLMAEAVENGMVAPHSTTAEYNLPIDWDNSYFVPYDYGYFAVMVDTELLSKPPQSLDNLIQARLRRSTHHSGPPNQFAGDGISILDALGIRR